MLRAAQSTLNVYYFFLTLFRLIHFVNMTDCDILAESLNASDPIELAVYQELCAVVVPQVPAEDICPCSAIVIDNVYSKPHCKELADETCHCTVNTYRLTVELGQACVQCPAPKFSPKTGVVFSFNDINLMFCKNCPKNSKYSRNTTDRSPCLCHAGYEGVECQQCTVGNHRTSLLTPLHRSSTFIFLALATGS
jgi:hypothetical protein